MNKKVVGVILIIVALVLGWWAWGQMKPYLAPPPAGPVEEPGADVLPPA